MKLFEKTLTSETKFEGRIIKVLRDTVELENGKTSAREVVCHNGGVCVAALTEQNEVLLVRQFRYPYKEVLLELPAGKLEKGEDPFLILLDGITDPHNLGAIIRSAECVGAHGVIVPERRAVGLTPAAVKASAGAIEHIKVARVVNMTRVIEMLKARNIWTYALTMDGTDYEKVNFKGGVALVVGSEGEGISHLVLENCDQKVSLPMAGHLDSLNASVAAGVVMYRVLSSRRA